MRILKLVLLFGGLILLVISGILILARRGEASSSPYIVFASDSKSNGYFDVYWMQADGSDIGRQTQTGIIATSIGETRSPDNEWRAFTLNLSGTAEIYKERTDNSGRQNLTQNPANDLDPRWSPDGEWIVFVSDRDGNSEIYRMKPDGTEQQNLTRSPAHDMLPDWWEPPTIDPPWRWWLNVIAGIAALGVVTLFSAPRRSSR